MKDLVVLGGNRLHAGFSLRKKELGIDRVIVVDWNKRPDYEGDVTICCDIKDAEAIWNRPEICWDNVWCVYTSADAAVASQAWLHKKMGLQIPDKNALVRAQVKGESSLCWEKAGILHKYSRVLNGPEEFDRYDGRNYIWKPNCSSGSRNITILGGNEVTFANVEKAWKLAAEASSDHKVIVEEFCEGTEYTIEMLGDGMGNVGVYGISKKYHTPYNTKNKIAVKLHYCPNDISNFQLEKLASFGQQCYRALGLSSSFGHLEVIVKPDNTLVPVEMGARSSGFIASHLVDLLHKKTSYLSDYAGVLRGEAVKDGITFDGNTSSMYYFYDVRPGTGQQMKTIMDFLPDGIVSYAHDRKGLSNGRHFSPIEADHERYGYEILGGKRDVLTIETVAEAEQKWNDAVICPEQNRIGEKRDDDKGTDD